MIKECFNAPHIDLAFSSIRYTRRVRANGMTAFIATAIDRSAKAVLYMLIRRLLAAALKEVPPARSMFNRPIKLKTIRPGNNLLRATR